MIIGSMPRVGLAAEAFGVLAASDTIDFTGTYTLKAGKSLTFDEVQGFSIHPGENGSSKLIIAGSAAVTAEHDSFDALGAAADGAGDKCLVWIQESGSLTVDNTGLSADATGLHLLETDTVRNDGLLRVTAAGGLAMGVSGEGAALIFSNAGDLVVDGQGFSAGVFAAHAAKIDNSGAATVTSHFGDGYAFELNEGGSFVNTGVITVAGDSARGVFSTGALDFDNQGKIFATGNSNSYAVYTTVGHQFTNSGTLSAGPEGTGTAVYLSNPDHIHATIDNSGVMRGVLALVVDDGFEVNSRETLNNSGKIFGLINLNGGDDVIVNTGRIEGEIHLGEGNDLYDGGHGVLRDGAVFGGFGNDTVTGGAGGDLLYGDDSDFNAGGRDLISGGKGDDSLHGGTGADTLIGGAGADELIGALENDTFVFLKAADSKVGHSDLIDDLEAGDRIDLSAIDADTTQAGNQAFVHVEALDGHAGQLAMSYDGGSDTTHLVADTDGDGAADMEVLILGDATGFDRFVL
jgi:Ca2+-binding RTX toxin-like protein